MDNGTIIKLLNKHTDIVEELRTAGVIRTRKVVADYGEYVASAINRSIQSKKKWSDEYRKIVSRREIYVQVWPK